MKKVFSLLACALIIGAPALALAQQYGDEDLGRNWNLRAGIFVPEKKDSRSKGGDVWLTIGAERAFYETDTWRATISIDYYGANEIYSVPFCLNMRANQNGFRYGAGAGLSLGHDVDKGMSALAYNFLIGYEISAAPNPVTVDLRYLGTNASKQQLNGWALTVGYSF